ncbi:MAG: TonB-dependent receptor plug domain-containing protein [Pseudomonadota bacterium]
MRHTQHLKAATLALAGTLAHPALLLADSTLPEVVVSATRSPTPVDQVTQSVTVITRAELEQRGVTQLDQALRQVNGLSLTASGPFGGATSARLRGLDGRNVLVLLDGVPLNDPSGVDKSFDFAAFDLAGIDRIEVLEGPASTLYGSEAMGGVINLISQPARPGLRGNVAADYGSFDTRGARAQVGGGTDRITFSLEGAHRDSDGVNKLNRFPASLDPREPDHGYRNNTLAGRADIHLPGDLRFGLRGRTEASWFEYDLNGTSNPGITGRTIQDRHSLGANLSRPLGADWLGSLEAGWVQLRRETPDDAFGRFFSGNQYRYSAKAEGSTGPARLTLGLDHDREQARNLSASGSTSLSGTSTLTAPYVFALWDFRPLRLSTGLRYNEHSSFGSKLTYQLGARYDLPTGTTFKANLGTGFKAPTLFQLFAPTYGNPNLQAEKSTGYDLGVEQALWARRLTVALTYFRQRLRNAVTFTFPAGYQNINQRRTRGLEASLNWRLGETAVLAAGYTHTNGFDVDAAGRESDFLLRVPEDQYFLRANYSPLRALRLDAELNYIGSRHDLFFGPGFTTTSVDTGNYALVNLAARYTLSRGLETYVRVDNLLDRGYQEVAGFTGLPRFVQAGVKAGF